MSEAIIQKPIRIMAGLCQTSDATHIQHDLELGSMSVSNPQTFEKPIQAIVPAIWALRKCFVKSRTKRSSNLEGMGVDYPAYEAYVLRSVAALALGEKLPPPPVTQGALWAAEIQEKTNGITLGMELMDPFHAAMYTGFIQRGKGHNWSPSTTGLGESILPLAEINGINGWSLGIKNPKFYSGDPFNENDEDISSLATHWAGMGSYALAAIHLPEEIMLIERGVLTKDMGNWRGIPVIKTAIKAKELLQNEVEKLGLQDRTRITLGKDISHDNGPKRREQIVQAGIEAAKNEKIDLILVETKPINGSKPLSDADQHITEKELQNMINEIAKFRPIFDRRELPKQYL